MLHKISIRIVVLCALLTATACKEVLYSELTEIEANEMVAILSLADIPASRERDKNGIYALLVDETAVASATIMLRNAGFPKKKFESLGSIFSASGIIGTPFEQHARYIHAMNEELSGAVSDISGIHLARVIVNTPFGDRHNRETPRASAAVTVHHNMDFSVSSNVAKIKQIISHSVDNLAYDDVSVAFFPLTGFQIDGDVPQTDMIEPNAASILPQSAQNWLSPEAARMLLICVVILAMGLAIYAFGIGVRSRRKSRNAKVRQRMSMTGQPS